MPKYRSELYAIWKSCERFKLRPEGVKECWKDNDVMTQALLIAYSQIRDCEDAELASAGLASKL